MSFGSQLPSAEPPPGKRRIYIASSWRNDHQPAVVELLRKDGHHVYDFRRPTPDSHGFDWRECHPRWKVWERKTYLKAIHSPLADQSFEHDFGAMRWADTCILLLPSGRSAHLEAGYFAHHPRQLVVCLEDDFQIDDAELMYRLADSICQRGDLLQELDHLPPSPLRARAE